MSMEWKAKYGPWALVTGASSGLGIEFVRQLASLGLNIVLVARRKDRMDALAQQMRETHRIETHVVAMDLTAENACERVAEETSDLEVGLLINNAGFGLSGSYSDLDPQRQANMTVLNCVVPVLLTNHFLPGMIDRGRGGLIFLASTAAYQPTPFLGTYGATKAFNLMLGESLWHEYRNFGIDSLALSPGFTRTEFTRVANIQDAGAFREATVDDVVATAIRKLGRQPSIVHGWTNKILAFSVRILPRRMVMAITGAALKGRTSH
ncbi:MAG TPA: oxidoreductase [Candidatus Latescibacteria bacterium]|nr:oxidoreductase [Gemmatimonadota bacterium]HCR16985.1 oxidoreductase [Candidatus Latescibacterota bacterium]